MFVQFWQDEPHADCPSRHGLYQDLPRLAHLSRHFQAQARGQGRAVRGILATQETLMRFGRRRQQTSCRFFKITPFLSGVYNTRIMHADYVWPAATMILTQASWSFLASPEI